MWEQIWREISWKRDSRFQTLPSPLADPPVIKELLKAEIQLLLHSLRERAANEGRDGDAVMSRYSPDVVSYAFSCTQSDKLKSLRKHSDTQETFSRPQSSWSQTNMRSCSRTSSSSNWEVNIEIMKHQLNVVHIDEIVAHLKSVLVEECEVLKSEVLLLQESVEKEHQTHNSNKALEPTVTELRQERKLILKDLQVQQMVTCVNGQKEDFRSEERATLYQQKTQTSPLHYRPYSSPTKLISSLPSFVRTPPERTHCTKSLNPSRSSPFQAPKLPRNHSWSNDAIYTSYRHKGSTLTSENCLPPLNFSHSKVTGPCLKPTRDNIETKDNKFNHQPMSVVAQGQGTCLKSINDQAMESTSGHIPMNCTPPLNLGGNETTDKRFTIGTLHPTPPPGQKTTRRGQSVTRQWLDP